ncbi:hypothetical protein DFH06DRAFT_1466347 [Mycena polygramma]|nr:hypothetical protein DFH06DRAFT_1466347 [Mycena polygramma]
MQTSRCRALWICGCLRAKCACIAALLLSLTLLSVPTHPRLTIDLRVIDVLAIVLFIILGSLPSCPHDRLTSQWRLITAFLVEYYARRSRPLLETITRIYSRAPGAFFVICVFQSSAFAASTISSGFEDEVDCRALCSTSVRPALHPSAVMSRALRVYFLCLSGSPLTASSTIPANSSRGPPKSTLYTDVTPNLPRPQHPPRRFLRLLRVTLSHRRLRSGLVVTPPATHESRLGSSHRPGHIEPHTAARPPAPSMRACICTLPTAREDDFFGSYPLRCRRCGPIVCDPVS